MFENFSLEKVIEDIKALQRPEFVDIKDEGHEDKPELLRIYNDGKKCYEPVFQPVVRNVSDIESFISVIAMEADRKENSTGKNMTVYMTQEGGTYYPIDSKICQDSYKFTRKLSDQWIIVKRMLDQELTHRELLSIFRKIKPSITSFDEIYRHYLDLKFLRNFELTSSPVISQDSGGAEIASIRYQISNGDLKTQEERTLPVSFELEIPYSRAGKVYDMNIEIIISIGEDGHKPVFTLVCPELELIEEQAIKDETNRLREELSEMTELYVHNNF